MGIRGTCVEQIVKTTGLVLFARQRVTTAPPRIATFPALGRRSRRSPSVLTADARDSAWLTLLRAGRSVWLPVFPPLRKENVWTLPAAKIKKARAPQTESLQHESWDLRCRISYFGIANRKTKFRALCLNSRFQLAASLCEMMS